MTDATLVSQIDNHLGELENTLAEIFGLTPDSDVTVSAFEINNSGQVTKQLVAWAQAGAGIHPLAFQITNTTTAVDAVVGLLIVGSGVVGSETWNYVFGIGDFSSLNVPPGPATLYDRDETLPGLAVLTGGELWGYLFTASAQGLVPRGSGNPSTFLCTDGNFKFATGFDAEMALVHTPVDASTGLGSTFTSSIEETPDWTDESFDDALHATDDPEFHVVTAGKYLVGAQAYFTPDGVLHAGTITATLYRDRGGVVTTIAKTSQKFDITGFSNIVLADALIDCEIADHLGVTFMYDDGIGTVTYTLGTSFTTSFLASRVA